MAVGPSITRLGLHNIINNYIETIRILAPHMHAQLELMLIATTIFLLIDFTVLESELDRHL